MGTLPCVWGSGGQGGGLRLHITENKAKLCDMNRFYLMVFIDKANLYLNCCLYQVSSYH